MSRPIRRLSVAAAALAAAVAGFASPATAGPIRADAQETTASYIVTLADSVGNVDTMAHQQTAALGARLGFVYKYAMKGYSAQLTPSEVKRLEADPSVAGVAPDGVVTIQAQSVPTGINRIDGELSSAVSGDGAGTVDVDVAVIDTGIDVDNPDLNVVGGTNCIGGTSFDDDNSHGTHVSGTIAAKDDGNGVVGVAPGARLYAVKVLNAAGSGSFAQIICGIDWVTARASTIEVANMSLGGTDAAARTSTCSSTRTDPLHPAICRSTQAGVTYAVAAGNSAADSNGFAPASYSEVITVSALADFNGTPGGGAASTCRADQDDSFADFSNFGADVDLIAPGVCIVSDAPGGGFNTFSGTSMASPHVAGAAALYRSTHAATPAQVRSALIAAATTNWSNADDRDRTKEPLLNVDTL